jgi:hypothetical protein
VPAPAGRAEGLLGRPARACVGRAATRKLGCAGSAPRASCQQPGPVAAAPREGCGPRSAAGRACPRRAAPAGAPSPAWSAGPHRARLGFGRRWRDNRGLAPAAAARALMRLEACRLWNTAGAGAGREFVLSKSFIGSLRRDSKAAREPNVEAVAPITATRIRAHVRARVTTERKELLRYRPRVARSARGACRSNDWVPMHAVGRRARPSPWCAGCGRAGGGPAVLTHCLGSIGHAQGDVEAASAARSQSTASAVLNKRWRVACACSARAVPAVPGMTALVQRPCASSRCSLPWSWRP